MLQSVLLTQRCRELWTKMLSRVEPLPPSNPCRFDLQQSPLQSGSSSNRKAGMSYPQFIEVLTLLATSASSRLRLLYPDVAGPVPSVTKEPSSDSDVLAESSADTATSRAGRSPVASDPPGAGAGGVLGSGDDERRTNAGGQLVHRKAMNVRAAMRFKNGRFVRRQVGCTTVGPRSTEPTSEYEALEATKMSPDVQRAVSGARERFEEGVNGQNLFRCCHRCSPCTGCPSLNLRLL